MASMNPNPDTYKNRVREAMEADGVHPKYVEDEHWVQLWRKHFEGSALLAPEVPFERPMEETFKNSNLRVLQWNLLAEGLVPEGFMMPLVSKAHVDRSDNFLQKLLESGKSEDLRTAAKLSSQGYRSYVWRQGEEGEQEVMWEEFARMACNMVLAMKGLPPSQKEERGLDLKKKYNPDLSGSETGQLTVNEKAVVGAEHRLLRVVWFVSLLKPDVICFQEVDNFSFLASEMQQLGYACSSPNAKEYQPLKDRTGSYSERLSQSQWSFAPKSGWKRGKSTARHFLEKRVKDGGHKAKFNGKEWPIDDDGQAIFWRKDRFEIIGEPEFLVLPGDADIDAFLDGSTDEPGCTQSDQAAVRVLLQFKAMKVDDLAEVKVDDRLHRQQFYVCTTHLSSGTDNEVHRIQQLHHLGRSWARSGLPEIWSLDANTEIDFEDTDMSQGSQVPIPEEANALQSFMQNNDLQSVWNTFYSDKRDIWDPPVSVWKMRGSASAQPKKVGEDMYQLIDHIFYDGRHLFEPGEQALRLREKKTDDPADRDWLALMPNELLPSDHLPIVWDFHLNVRSPRWEPIVLVNSAEQLFTQLKGALPADDPHLDQIQALFQPLYRGGLQTRKTDEKKAGDDAVLEVLDVLKKFSDEAKAVLHYDVTESVSHLESFRERIIKSTGRHQSKATYETSLLQTLLFSAAATVAAGSWVVSSLFGELKSCITLAAMRCVLRTLTAAPCEDKNFVEVMSEGQLWALLAQLTTIINPNCPYIVKAFDQNGMLTLHDMDAVLGEIGEQLANRRNQSAPALCVLRCINWRKCATGTHVAAAVKMLMQAIEGGKLPFLEHHLISHGDRMEEMQAVPTNMSAMSTIRMLRANTGGDNAQPPLPPELQHKQTFDQSAAISALASLANSGNLDSGGGLALLLESLQRQMALAEGNHVPERQARALHRPPSWVVASFVRRTVVSALERMEPIEALVVSAQKLHVQEHATKKRARLNPVEELIQALVDFPQDGPQSQAHTFGRILRLLVKVTNKCGPKALLSPMVARNGMDRLTEVLECLALLPEQDLQRWKTHLHLNRLIDLLLSADLGSDSLALALQKRISDAVKEPSFKGLLMKRPSMEEGSPRSYDLSKILEQLDKFDSVNKLSA